MRLRVLGALAAALLAVGCSSTPEETDAFTVAANAPDYCKQLAKMPAGLQDAVGNASSGDASAADKRVIAQGAQQLHKAAGAAGVPADFGKSLKAGATSLENLSSGHALSQSAAKSFAATFENLERTVKSACASS